MRTTPPLILALALAAGTAFAQSGEPVQVQQAWVRAAVPGQRGTGAFMTLTARSDLRLVGVASPLAGVAELHEMKLEGDTMKMRAVEAIALPARRPVELKPGGLHLMLMDLKQPLPAGGSLPLTLRFEDAHGARSTLELSLPVRGGPAAAPAHRH